MLHQRAGHRDALVSMVKSRSAIQAGLDGVAGFAEFRPDGMPLYLTHS
jgi:hypothetical protein